jgi:hypothetical protein
MESFFLPMSASLLLLGEERGVVTWFPSENDPWGPNRKKNTGFSVLVFNQRSKISHTHVPMTTMCYGKLPVPHNLLIFF